MHLTDEQLNEYLDHESSERGEIEVHISTCVDCAARLSALQALFDEIESLPELELTRSIAARLMLPSNLPAKLPRSLTLTVILQAALAIVTLIVAAPFVMQFLSPYLISLSVPSLGDVLLQIQSQWTVWLDMLSQIHIPTIPKIPVVELSSFFILLAVAGVSLLWLIGNGLLLRNK
jgi:hypothetical protein